MVNAQRQMQTRYGRYMSLISHIIGVIYTQYHLNYVSDIERFQAYILHYSRYRFHSIASLVMTITTNLIAERRVTAVLEHRNRTAEIPKTLGLGGLRRLIRRNSLDRSAIPRVRRT